MKNKVALICSVICLLLAYISIYFDILGPKTIADVFISAAFIINIFVLIDLFGIKGLTRSDAKKINLKNS